MSTVRIDKKHLDKLDKLIATLTLRGSKITKKDLIGKLIEEALIAEGIMNEQDSIPLEKDPAWIGLDKTHKTGISDLSERVDEYLYESSED